MNWEYKAIVSFPFFGAEGIPLIGQMKATKSNGQKIGPLLETLPSLPFALPWSPSFLV